MTFRIRNAIECIREYRKKAGIARFKFACMAGIPEGSTRNIDHPSWNPTLSTLIALDEVVPADFVITNEEPKRKVKKKLNIQKAS
jgi:predicted transcriptional regulator